MVLVKNANYNFLCLPSVTTHNNCDSVSTKTWNKVIYIANYTTHNVKVNWDAIYRRHQTFVDSCRTLHLSVIQEEHEEISPAITLLRKPRFSRHFSKKREDSRYLSWSPRTDQAQTEDKFTEIKRSKSPEPEPESSGSDRESDHHKMGLKSRRSSDSSVVSSPFKVLPPITNVSEDSDKEGETELKGKGQSASQSNEDQQDPDESEKELSSSSNLPKQTPKVVRYTYFYLIVGIIKIII